MTAPQPEGLDMTLTIEQARHIAAQCWCEPETSGIEMDARLAEAFARALLSASKPAVQAHCQCSACKDGAIHASDCAVHNAPALPVGECNCGAAAPAQSGEPVACLICNSTGNSTPCAYPTEINRQQAKRIAELVADVAENDALIDALREQIAAPQPSPTAAPAQSVEPVAWRVKKSWEPAIAWRVTDRLPDTVERDDYEIVPLYIAPAPSAGDQS